MVDDEAILGARKECAEKEGFLMCPEGAATFAAYQKELKSGRIGNDESVVMFNCAAGTKYELPEVTRQLDRTKLIPYGEL
jgi:threonine synthase